MSIHDGPLVVVGAGGGGVLAQLAKFQPPRSVILVEEPDVVRKRGTRRATADSPALLDLIECAYQEVGAADRLYNRRRDLRPCAVVPLMDYAVPFAARLAERYGVVGGGYGAASILRDKALMRSVTASAGIANPRSVEVNGPADVTAFMAEVGGPIVLKPANRRASVGTKVVLDPADVEQSWLDCLDQDEGTFVPDRPMPLRMLAEQFIRGDEFSVEMMVRRGEPLFAAPTRKFIFDGPRPIEQGHLHPADLDRELTERLLSDTVRVLDAVGFDSGFVHCEWIVQDGVPTLVECGGRMAGDWIIDLAEIAWQYDIVEQYYTMMKGGEPTAPPPTAAGHAAIWMARATTAGEVERVDGADRARTAPGVRTVIAVGAGDEVRELRCSWDRVAGVIADGPTPAAALANARNALELITIQVRPTVPA